jgi:hypothetical protein
VAPLLEGLIGRRWSKKMTGQDKPVPPQKQYIANYCLVMDNGHGLFGLTLHFMVEEALIDSLCVQIVAGVRLTIQAHCKC